MRRMLILVVVLAACTTPTPAPEPLPAEGVTATPAGPPTQLPAVEPELPTLAEFRRMAAAACTTAGTTIAAARVPKDPFRDNARPRDIQAAIAYYRTAAAAWTTAAGDLFDFGLPRERVAERLITSLDTVARYNHEAAELLEDGDYDGAQLAVGAADTSTYDAAKIAERLGISRIEDCGRRRQTLDGARRVRVIATDFQFTTGAASPGPVRFVMRNAGDEPHQLYVVRLREAGTLDDAVRADRSRRRPGPYLRGRGTASPVASPGGRVTVDVGLRRGVYGLLCFVGSADGTPHAYKGMATELVVN